MILVSVVSVIETNCTDLVLDVVTLLSEAMQNLKYLQDLLESFSKALLISKKCIYDNISSLPVVRNSSLGWINLPPLFIITW